MQKWIGTLKQGTITGLFQSGKTCTLSGEQQQSLKLSDGDLVTVIEPSVTGGSVTTGLVTGDSGAASATHEIMHLADAGSPASVVYQILAEKALDPNHPDACEQEAREWLLNPGHDTPGLSDLTHLPFVTIDNEDSRDLDQALYISKDQTDQICIHYALADAAYYVRPGTAIFREAIRRAVTYYVPGLSVPMLPRALSEDLVSLNPNVVRRALLFRITVNTNGESINTDVSRVLIRSQAKLAYQKVQELYDNLELGKAHPYHTASYGQSLLNLQEVGQRRILHAQRRDVIDYNRSEPRVTVSNTPPAGFAIELRQRCDCEKYNEQVSLLCNMEGARLLEQLQHNDNTVIHSIFRVHSPPLTERLTELRQSLSQLCDAHGLDDQWRWQAGQPLADYLAALPVQSNTAGTAAGNTNASNTDKDQGAKAFAIRMAIERMILLTNRASFFSDEPGPHHALGVQSYARFSSPMREIAGIFTHKELLEALNLEQANRKQHDEQLQDTIVKAANASKRLQKELDHEFHLKAIETYFHRDLLSPLAERPVRQATVMGMRSGKIYVTIDGFGADVKLYLDDLGKRFNTRYQVTGVLAVPKATSSTVSSNAPTFKIGDRLSLRLLHHDQGNRRFVLAPV